MTLGNDNMTSPEFDLPGTPFEFDKVYSTRVKTLALNKITKITIKWKESDQNEIKDNIWSCRKITILDQGVLRKYYCNGILNKDKLEMQINLEEKL